MKRAPLKRKTPLTSQSTLKRHRAQRKRSPKKSTYTKELRQSVYERDGGLCQVCGRRGEQVHHVIPRGRFFHQWYTFDDVNNPINLMLVCHKCHHDIHNAPGMLEKVIAMQEERFGPLRQTVDA